MSNADASLKQQLKTLCHLQDCDMSLLSIRKQLQEIPRQIAQLDASVSKASEATAATATALAEVEKAQRSKNAAIEMNAVQREKYKAEQRTVTSNEAYSALERQIEFLNQQDADTEDEILVLMEEGDRLKTELAERESEAAQENERTAEQKAALQQQQRDLKMQWDEKREKRKEILPEIEPELLAQYHRWIERQRPPFVADGSKGFCGSCRISIQPQTLKEAQKYEKLVRCSTCKRALYMHPPSAATG